MCRRGRQQGLALATSAFARGFQPKKLKECIRSCALLDAMSGLAKYLLYPILLPVVAIFELGRWGWSRVGSRSILVIILAYFFGPTVTASLALEVANYLWNAGKHWSVCTVGTVASFAVLLGVIWPLLVLCLGPILTILELATTSVSRRAGRAIEFFFDLLARMAAFSPMAFYWRTARGVQNNSIFLGLLSVYSLLSATYHVTWILIPLWKTVMAYLGVLPFTIITQVVLSCWALAIPISAFGISGFAFVSARKTSLTMGMASAATILNALSLPYIQARTWTEVLPSLLTGYLFLFFAIFPLMDILSQRGFVTAIVLNVWRLWRELYRMSSGAWKSAPAIDWALLTFLPVINALMTIYIASLVGLNAWLTCIHVCIFILLETFGFGTPHLSIALLVFGSTQYAVQHLAPIGILGWASTLFRFGGFVPAIYYSLMLTEGIILPMLSPIIIVIALSLRALPSSVSNLGTSVRHRLRTYIADGLQFVIEKMINMFEDRSSFGTMIGWLMTAGLVAVAVTASLLSSTGPVSFFLAQAGSVFRPSLVSFNYQPIELNRTSITNSTVPASGAPNDPQISLLGTGSLLVDSVLLVTLAFNFVILLGKLASAAGSLAFSVYTGVGFFVYYRHLDWVQTNYPIISTAVALELALLSVAFSLIFVYGSLLYLTRPYVARYAPIICIPFERMHSLQRWVFLITVHQCSLVWRALVSVWDGIFAPKHQHVQPQPLYVRPRRYQ